MALDDAHAGPLPCGTFIDDLIVQVTEGSPPLDRAHQAACRYCQAALEAIREAWEEFQSVARAAIAVPEDLTERILARIQSLIAGGDEVVVDVQRGETRVADVALARLARAAAMTVPDVGLASVVAAEEDPEAPGAVAVSLRLVVVLGPPIEQIAGAVRERVIAELQSRAGTTVSRVDVAVEDVVDDRDAGS